MQLVGASRINSSEQQGTSTLAAAFPPEFEIYTPSTVEREHRNGQEAMACRGIATSSTENSLVDRSILSGPGAPASEPHSLLLDRKSPVGSLNATTASKMEDKKGD